LSWCDLSPTLSPCLATIYFDYNATTPLDPAVREVILRVLAENWGNPPACTMSTQRGRCSTMRATGWRNFSALSEEIIFTSGGTEANNLAIFGTARALKNQRQNTHHFCHRT